MHRDKNGRFCKKPVIVVKEKIFSEDELINKLIREMEKSLTKGGLQHKGGIVRRSDSSCALWASVNAKGETFHAGNQACHYELNHALHVNPLYIASRIMHGYNPRPIPQDVMERYFDWLVNRSPWTNIFVNKMGGIDTVKLGYVVVRTNVPSNLMAGALIAARMSTEHAGTIALVWDYLAREGVNEEVAFCHAFAVDCSDHKNIVLEQKSEWHSCWDGKNFDKQMVLNFFNRDAPNKNSNYQDEDGKYFTYRPICNAWGRPNRNPFTLKELEPIKDKATGKEKKESKNPFAAKMYEKELVPVDKFCKFYAEWLKEVYPTIHQVNQQENAA